MIAAIIFLCFFTIVILLVLNCDRILRPIIFHPSKYPHGDWAPDDIHFEEVRFPVGFDRRNPSRENDPPKGGTASRESGEHLVGWYFPHPRNRPKHVFLYCHGNCHNITRFPRFADLLRCKYDASVLVFDYRGFGKSDGSPTITGIYEDGRSALYWLADKEKMNVRDIVVWGHSIGGAVAVGIAARESVRALIVESSFTSISDLAKKVIPYFPAKRVLRENMNSLEIISRYRGPVFISHGKADEAIPFEHGVALYEAANEPKTFYETAEGFNRHSDDLSDEHFRRLSRFLESLNVPDVFRT